MLNYVRFGIFVFSRLALRFCKNVFKTHTQMQSLVFVSAGSSRGKATSARKQYSLLGYAILHFSVRVPG